MVKGLQWGGDVECVQLLQQFGNVDLSEGFGQCVVVGGVEVVVYEGGFVWECVQCFCYGYGCVVLFVFVVVIVVDWGDVLLYQFGQFDLFDLCGLYVGQ